MGDVSFWVGTYPVAGAGTPAGLGEGIWSVRMADGGLTGARQVAVSPAPSFLAAHPSTPVLYAVGETAPGTLGSFAVGPDGRLDPVTTVASGGDHPCHLAVTDRAVYVANYGSGTVAVHLLDAAGALLAGDGAPAQVQGLTGSGPDAERQAGSHAHFVTVTPDGEHLLAVDLGADRVWRFRLAPDGLLEADGVAAVLPPGAGPRHLVFAADGRWCYLSCELDATVRVLAWDGPTATGREVQAVAVGGSAAVGGSVAVGNGATRGESAGGAVGDSSADGAPAGVGAAFPAHVDLADGHVVVSVRGPDTLAVLDVDPATGLLGPVRSLPAPSWPRHFAVLTRAVPTQPMPTRAVPGEVAPPTGEPSAGDLAVVTGERSGTLAVIRLDGADGGPADELALPSPACVIPA